MKELSETLSDLRIKTLDLQRASENAQIALQAEGLLKEFKKVFKKELDLREPFVGGVLSMLDPRKSENIASFQLVVGNADPDRVELFRDLSLEKTLRARLHDQVSSLLADHDPSRNQWGGGFWIVKEACESFGIGFSGMSESLDSLYCLTLMVRVGMISSLKAIEITQEVDNAELTRCFEKAKAYGLV